MQQTEIVVVTASGQQFIGYEEGDMFYPRNGASFPSVEIATVIRKENSIYATD